MIAPSEFQCYLQSILDASQEDNQQEIRDRYISTLAALPLRVQTCASSKADSQEQQEERREQFAVLEGLRKYASEHVLLVGKPGSGKSTSLRRLLLEEAGPCLEAIEHNLENLPLIPVLVELRECRDGSVLGLIQKGLQRQRLRLKLEKIEDLLFEGCFLLLLDGLNELPNQDAWQAVDDFRQNYPDVPMVFTTRELGSGLVQGNVKKLEMLPLTEPQMREFVQKRLPETGGEMLRQIQGRLRELAETPLLLKLLCDVFEQNGEVPKSRGDLFRKEFAQRYEEFKPERLRNVSEDSRRFAFDLLSYLAFTMVQGELHTDCGKLSASWITISKAQAEKILANFLASDRTPDVAVMANAKEWLEDLLEWHLLQVASDRDRLEFHHQLFQEYYAAERLEPQLKELSDEELKYKYLNYLKWTEPLAMALGLVDSPDLVVRVVKLALEVDLYLGARLAGTVKPQWQEQTVGLVAGLEIPKLLKIDLLGITKSGQAIPQLERALEDRNALVCWLAVLRLEEIGNAAAVNALAKALEDKNFSVRFRLRTISALEAIGNAAAVNALVKVLTYEDSDVRRNAAYALGRISNPAAINGLVQVLEDEEADVRRSAVQALGAIGDSAATNALTKALQYGIADVRQSAAYALCEIRNLSAVESLVQALEDEEADVRRSAAHALGEIGDPAAVNPLVQALKDNASLVRESAAYALYEIGVGDSDTVEGLINTLKDKSPSVRRSAIRTLEKVGNPVAIDSLLQALIDKDFNVHISAVCALHRISNSTGDNGLVQALKYENPRIRRKAASALGEFGNLAAVDGLVQALKDEDTDVRWRAAFALGKIGNMMAVGNLAQALKDEEPSVRWSAAIALGEIGNSAAVDNLVKALKDEEASVRGSVASALGEIGNPATVKALVQALEDEDTIVRWTAVSSLKKIGNSAAVNGLLKALKDESAYVREHVVFVLKEIVNPTAIDGLVKAVEDNEAAVRRSAVYALIKIDNPTAVNALIKALKDEEASVRSSAAYALGEIGNPSTVNSLVQVLNDKEASVRSSVASALGKIGNPSTVGSLVQALKDQEASVRRSAASALGKIGNPIAVSALVQALEDKEPSVGKNAAYALGKIGNPTAVNALINVLDHEDSVVYESAALALGKTGNVAAVDGLVKALKGETSNIRRFAASCLGKISNPAAVNALVQALQDENKDVREDAASVLNKVSKVTAINTLVQALKDENFVVANQGDTFGQTIEALQATQKRCGFYHYEFYQQAQETNNLGVENDFLRKLYEDLDKVISQIQENPELRQNDKEDRLTIDIVNQLRCLGYDASHESKIGGHVDVVVREIDFLWLGEAKFYRDNNYLWEGFQQLATRYSIGDSNQTNGGLLIYIREEDASSIMEKWQSYLLEKSLPNYSVRPCKMRSLAFISTHRHERSGQAFHVRHIPVMLHFAPKDKSGRRRKESP